MLIDITSEYCTHLVLFSPGPYPGPEPSVYSFSIHIIFLILGQINTEPSLVLTNFYQFPVHSNSHLLQNLETFFSKVGRKLVEMMVLKTRVIQNSVNFYLSPFFVFAAQGIESRASHRELHWAISPALHCNFFAGRGYHGFNPELSHWAMSPSLLIFYFETILTKLSRLGLNLWLSCLCLPAVLGLQASANVLAHHNFPKDGRGRTTVLKWPNQNLTQHIF